jgi:hypothetical protein
MESIWEWGTCYTLKLKSFMGERTGRGKLNMAALTFAETALWPGVMAPSSLRQSRVPVDPIVL